MPEELDADFHLLLRGTNGKSSSSIFNFTAGELSPRLDGRTDLKNILMDVKNFPEYDCASTDQQRETGTKFAMDAKFIDGQVTDTF